MGGPGLYEANKKKNNLLPGGTGQYVNKWTGVVLPPLIGRKHVARHQRGGVVGRYVYRQLGLGMLLPS
jgi:hypothetical protein